MRRKVTITTLTLALFVGPMMIASMLSAPAGAPPPPIRKTDFTNPYLQRVLSDWESHIRHKMKQTGVPGVAVAVVKDSSIVFLQGFGKRAVDSSAMVDTHTVFRIGSVSKCFAAVLTATLVHDGVLHWDDRVIDYLPDFRLKSKEATEKLTIRNVLSHTTGLPPHSYTTLVEDGLSLDSMLERLSDVDMAEVGKYYSYQNVAFSLIGKIIEKATGKSYEENLKERVFLPLGMWDASASYEEILSQKDVAYPNRRRGWNWHRISISPNYYNVTPAGGVNASISDMARWMQALLGNREEVIDTESLNAIFAPEVYAPVKNHRYRQLGRIRHSAYGLGWRVLHYSNDTIVFHSGYVNGYLSEVAVDLKHHLGVCVLSSAPGNVAVEAIPYLLDKYHEKADSIEGWDEKERVILAKNKLR